MIKYADPRIKEIQAGQWLGPGFEIEADEPLILTTGKVNPKAQYEGRFYCCAVCAYVYSDTDRAPCTNDGKTYVCIGCRGEDIDPKREVGKQFTPDVPALYTGAEITDHPRAIAEVVKRWPKTEKFITLCGNAGCGKTHACWGMVKALARQGIHVRYFDCRDARRDWLQSDQRRRSELEYRWGEVIFLILDDISGSNASDGWSSMV